MRPTRCRRSLALLCSILVTSVLSAAEPPVIIRLGTILPSGTAQHAALQELGERWRKDSGGAVKLTLYPDGRLGGEAEMVKKMRIKQLNAGLFSAVGLAEIDGGARALQVMPLMFRSWDEVDHVRERVRPQLEDKIRAKGYEVLFWADAGWVSFFARTPAIRPDDFRRLKMFAWVGEPEQLDIMRAMRCQPVALETTDILLGLNTDMIATVAVPPLIALAGQIYRPAPHMLRMNWAPIVGATVVRTDVWEKIPASLRPLLRASAEEIGKKIRDRGRQENEEAIAAMSKHGLKIHPLDTVASAEWKEVATELHAQIRGKIVPAEMFDAVTQHLQEYRSVPAGSAR